MLFTKTKSNILLYDIIHVLFSLKALEIEANDKNCLVARSKCHLKLGDAKAALKDAEAALEDDPEFNKVRKWIFSKIC